MISIAVNSEKAAIAAGTTLEQLLISMRESRAPDKIVEVNRQYVPSKHYADHILQNNDVIEIIDLCFGG